MIDFSFQTNFYEINHLICRLLHSGFVAKIFWGVWTKKLENKELGSKELWTPILMPH